MASIVMSVMSVKCHIDEQFLQLSGSVGRPSILSNLEIVAKCSFSSYALCV